jgi:V-type H+-transporting ATPase subunit E
VRFIKREAEEKANEIMSKAEQDFDLEKHHLVENEKQSVQREFTRKDQRIEEEKRIKYSAAVNRCRLKLLEEQGRAVDAGWFV